MSPFNLEIGFFSLGNFSSIISLMISSPSLSGMTVIQMLNLLDYSSCIPLFFPIFHCFVFWIYFWEILSFSFLLACLFVFKAYFCFLSSKIASYSSFMGAISSLILENKSWLLPSGFIKCLFWLLVCLLVFIIISPFSCC